MFNRGWISLNRDELQRIYVKLATHHSFDPRLLARIKAKMELQPWKCPCGRLNKKVARTCASCKCGFTPAPQAWQWDQTTWPNWDQQQRVKTPRAQSARSTNSNRTDRTDRTDQTDRAEAAAPRANSPRKRTNQPSRRQRRSKKSTNTFRGDAADGPSSWFQEPTWSSNLPRLQSVPTSTPASSAISSAEKQLRTLTGMLNVVLPDLPRHITPLQIHHLDDFVILFQERPCAYA